MSEKIGRTFAQVKAEEKKWANELLKVNCLLDNDSGIYILTRVDEMGIKYAYIGQAVSVLTRLVQHLMGRKQHIDRSLAAHGLYNKFSNPFGWNVNSLYCRIDKLDEMEREYIKKYATMGYQLRNHTIGGQDKGKNGLDYNQEPKGYHDGLHNGYKKAIKEIAVLFEKYLDVSIKGETNKVKQRKLGEFIELLEQFTTESEKVARKGENE